MRGGEISLMLTADSGDRALSRAFHGRVEGDSIRGKESLSGGGEREWTATRVRRGAIKISDE
jgi:hypothetical protein